MPARCCTAWGFQYLKGYKIVCTILFLYSSSFNKQHFKWYFLESKCLSYWDHKKPAWCKTLLLLKRLFLLTWICSHTFCFPISISWVVPPSRSISFAATSIMHLISALFSGHADTLWIATHSASRYRKTGKLKVLLHMNCGMEGTTQIQHPAIQLILV